MHPINNDVVGDQFGREQPRQILADSQVDLDHDAHQIHGRLIEIEAALFDLRRPLRHKRVLVDPPRAVWGILVLSKTKEVAAAIEHDEAFRDIEGRGDQVLHEAEDEDAEHQREEEHGQECEEQLAINIDDMAAEGSSGSVGFVCAVA